MKILSEANHSLTKSVAACIITLLFVFLAFSPLASCEDPQLPMRIQQETMLIPQGETPSELDLLRGEHYLYLNATDDVDEFHIRFSFPPAYSYQAPILFELLNDSTAPIINYRIENDKNEPNKIINFTIGALQKADSVFLHFYFWVVIINHDYSDLPRYVKLPRLLDLPQDTRLWLSSTEVVQARNPLIRHQARQLERCTTNLLTFAKRTVLFTKYHHYLRFLLQLVFGTFKRQDALTTLFRNGECPGRSHLECALFRANNIPARVILATPHYDFWYQIHCMAEFYCPGYGWVLTEVHDAIVAHEPKNQIILRVCSPDDEDNTGRDYFFPKMTGVERWYWIDNDAIVPYYKDFIEGSKSNMFPEKETPTDQVTAEFAFSLTNLVFRYYQQYLGMDLTGENLAHFQQAVNYQTQAIQTFISLETPTGYLSALMNAYEEYQQINI